MDNVQKIAAIKTALIAGAHSLFVTPMNKRANSKGTNRIPLHSWLSGGGIRYLVILELMHRLQADVGLIARAVMELAKGDKVFIDAVSIDATDVGAVQEFLEDILMHRREANTSALDTNAKIYVRDLEAAKPAGKTGSIIQAPDWLIAAAVEQGGGQDVVQVNTAGLQQVGAE